MLSAHQMHTRPGFSVSLALLLLACAPAMQSSGLQDVVTERLYFGRNVANTLVVSDSAWAAFLREVVSTRLQTALQSGPPRASGAGKVRDQDGSRALCSRWCILRDRRGPIPQSLRSSPSTSVAFVRSRCYVSSPLGAPATE